MAERRDLSEAQQDLKHRRDLPVRGHPYTHYKGGGYIVLAVSLLESDGTPVVTYENTRTAERWTRPVAEFQEHVTWPDGSTGPRFRYEP